MEAERLPPGRVCLDRGSRAVEKVRERLLLATSALRDASVGYAVLGANAVAEWVARVDPGAIRNTPNVDILIERRHRDAATQALAGVGFLRTVIGDRLSFLDQHDTPLRAAVRFWFAGEKVREHYLFPAPNLDETTEGRQFRVVLLEPLVRMKLDSNRTIDKVHVRDMIDVGLVDAGWLGRFPPQLDARLQHLIDTPDG